MSRYVLLLFLNAFLSTVAQILLKKSANSLHSSIIDQYVNLYVIVGYAIYVVVVLINIYVVKYVSINIVSAISESLPFVCTILSGYFIFNERISKYKCIGIIIILLGIIIITI